MNTQSPTIPGEDTTIPISNSPSNDSNCDCPAKGNPERLNINEKLFMLSNYRLDTDNGELFVAMFG
ncbi:hypothetical protein [Mucilaginibacter sp. L3T2-6]|uniref:hypothetical protein n=1 Tax=Mucilaginibacter sp. L3T2-6 TaxID=3062491 RepID=UPI0026767E21|nr:hypothetical protein [Mucilaginibacter sp. L3T2-6]MDO3641214.1 hypothetical protein [Mucilaginibacter sp. L3T2-6]MDV6213310.1 hypothetical protein [Mucilaginibacter sp. L3T2-6]